MTEKNLIGEQSRASRLSIADIPTRASRRYPEKNAFIISDTGEEVTAAAFNDRVNAISHAILDAGLEKGDRLGILAGNSMDLLAVSFGALKAGVVSVILNVRITPEDVEYQFTDSDVEAVIIDDEFYEKARSPFLDANPDVPVLAYIEQTGGVDIDAPELDSFIDHSQTGEPEVAIDDDDPAIVVYTSGTTSTPKGVVHTHRSYSWGIVNTIIGGEIRRYDTLSSMLPMYHTQQFIWAVSALSVSATTVIHREFDPIRLLEDVDGYGISYVNLMSSMYRRLFNSADLEEYDTTSIRKCIYGMPMEMSLRERITEEFGGGREPELITVFGQTEVLLACFFKPEWQFEKEGNYVGEAAPFIEVEIMDDEGNVLPPGEVGEIVYRGPSIMKEYLNEPEKTASGFDGGWRHSGDLGIIDEDGQLQFYDRKGDMIKTGGVNVSTSKIENVLGDHPDVDECAVVGLPHERWTEAVTAFVIPHDPESASPGEIGDYARERLSGPESPKDVLVVDQLPFTSTGKIRKTEIRDEYDEYYRD